MKVVVTGTRGIPDIMGGVETHCEELLPRLVSLGYDITVIRRKNYVREGKPRTEWKGVKIIDIDAPKSKYFEAIIHTFRAIHKAKALGADLIHIHTIGPNLLTPYARLLGLKVVMTHHGPDYDRDKWGMVAKMMLRLGEQFGCRFANQVIVISHVIKTLIANKCNRKDDVSLIYNGVTQPEICSYPEYFSELGIEEGKYILGMCRFVPEKNLHHLIDAFMLLKNAKRIPEDMRLVLAGDTDFEDDYSRLLKTKARENGVVLTGFIKGRKLHSLLSNASCYCLPSSHEGLPIALLEAMSYSIPVVASDIPANLEIGLDESYYFPCGNIEKLAERLLEKSSLSHKIHYDMHLYDWDIIAKQTGEVYNKTNVRSLKLKTLRIVCSQDELAYIPEGKTLINTIYAYSYVVAQQDEFFAKALCKCDYLMPDGAGIVMACRWLKSKSQPRERIAGSDLFTFEMERLNNVSLRNRQRCETRPKPCVMFMGSSERVLSLIRERAAIDYPNLEVVTYSPPYKAEFSDEDNQAMIRAINEANPDLLWIGMTAPKQEKWAYKHWNELNIHCHCGTIGAVFDFYAGTVKRAPLCWQKHSLEWLYRLLSEPARMWRRYLIGNVKFLYYIYKERRNHLHNN